MIIYALKTCDTCRKAIKMVNEAGLEHTVFDVRKDGVPREKLEEMFASLGGALINRSSTTWRSLSEHERAADPVSLLVEHPTLMKRPVFELDGTFRLGWKADVQAVILG